ncbi:MAG: pyridoxamine kinase [Clostridia bacterium]|nr:pyridoxamine kinase [Clostridia bacterium]
MQKLSLSLAPDRQKRVLAVHDISCVGRCSLTVALPVLSAMGFETSVLPTSILSTHTGGFEGYTCRDLAEDMLPIAEHWHTLGLRFDAVFTGWLGSHRHIARLERALAALDDGARLIVDPVMGDNGRLYATLDEAYVAAMRDFGARAEMLLPNLTEAALITGMDYPGEQCGRAWAEEALDALLSLGARTAVLTGVRFGPERIGAAARERSGQTLICDSEYVPGMWHGAGDVFASALTGACLQGRPLAEGLRMAVDFTAACIRRTRAAGTDERLGLQFEPELMRLAGAGRSLES